jgi:hypothetical protein
MNLWIPLTGFIKMNVQGEQAPTKELLIGHLLFTLFFPLVFWLITAIYKVLFWISGLIFSINLSFKNFCSLLSISLSPLFLLGSFPILSTVGTLWSFALIIIGTKSLAQTSYLNACILLLLSLTLVYLIVWSWSRQLYAS